MLTFVLCVTQIFVKTSVQLDITSDNKGLLIPRMDFGSLDVSEPVTIANPTNYRGKCIL